MKVGDIYIWKDEGDPRDIIQIVYLDDRFVRYVYTQWECGGEKERNRFENIARPLTKLDKYLLLGNSDEV